MAESPTMANTHSSPSEQSSMEERNPQESALNTIVSPSIFQKYVAEMMGTYILVFVGCAPDLIYREKPLTTVGIAMVWGLVLMVVKYTLGHISGAHVNPAVTISLTAARKFPLKHVGIYVLAQVVGATLACLNLKLLFHDQTNIKPTVTHFSSSTSDLRAIAWESTITFILMFTTSAVSTDHRAYKELFGVAIGAAAAFNIILAGQITGASMNPARSIGPAIVSGVYKKLWVYVIGPVLGATAAALTYNVLRVPESEKEPDEKKSKERTEIIHNDLYNSVLV